MNHDSWQRLEALFHAVKDLPASQRETALRAHAPDDPALVAEVLRLLAAHGRDTLLQDSPVSMRAQEARAIARAAEHAADAATPSWAPQIGDSIGPYTILEMLGEGGMGLVFLAQQERPVRRRLALKIIKPGMDTTSVLARFAAEQQAMALMDHPNLARVYEAGRSEHGHPYFVMEYVKGVPITTYCQQERLGVRRRLALFIALCDAIQHAHQKGIIHRDLKPSNILVSRSDDRDVLKVIDFGVAKAVDQRLSEHSFSTRHGQMIGTPAYMSPEQADLGARQVDTRADIYSLGIILYELLTGTLPFDRKRFQQASLSEILRILREEEPPRPSTRLIALGSERGKSGETPSADSKSLIRILQGDLDWVVMKSLEKSLERRYQSAHDLAADIHRFLRHEPVLAGPPSGRYRLRKFVRRNRVAVFAGALVVATMLVGSLGTTLGLLTAQRARRQAVQEAAIAQAVVSFLNDDLLSAPALEAHGRDATVYEVLTAATQNVEGKFQDLPLVEAAVRATLGRTSLSIGEHEVGHEHLSRSLQLYRQHRGPKSEEALDLMNALGQLERERGQLAEAESLLVLAHESASDVLGPEHATTLSTIANLGEIYRLRGDAERGIALVEPAVERAPWPPDDRPELSITLRSTLASLRYEQGQGAQAEAMYRELLEVGTEKLGPDHPEVLAALNNLASILHAQGRYEEAETFHRLSYERRMRVFGPDHLRTLSALQNLGNVLLQQGRLEEAEPYLSEALAQRERRLPPDDWYLMVSLGANAELRRELGHYTIAESLARRSVRLREAKFGPEHARTLAGVRMLGTILRRAGKFDEAEAVLSRAWRVDSEQSGPTSSSALLSLDLLLELARDQGRFEEVVRRSSEAIDHLRTLESEAARSRLGRFLFLRGGALGALGRHEEAETDLLESHELAPQDMHAPNRCEANRALVELYTRWGKAEQAARWQARLPAG